MSNVIYTPGEKFFDLTDHRTWEVQAVLVDGTVVLTTPMYPDNPQRGANFKVHRTPEVMGKQLRPIKTKTCTCRAKGSCECPEISKGEEY